MQNLDFVNQLNFSQHKHGLNCYRYIVNANNAVQTNGLTLERQHHVDCRAYKNLRGIVTANVNSGAKM
jgi:hypothetical protein